MSRMGSAPELPTDRLDERTGLEAIRLDGVRVGGPQARAPHRHDYHELLWIRSGAGTHRLDGATLPVTPGAVTVIGRGQVHVFERGEDLHGVVVRFGPDLVPSTAGAGWLVDCREGRTIAVPGGEVPRLEALLEALIGESARPADARTGEITRHLLATLLLWLERWYDDAHTEQPAADAPEVLLHRRFAALLDEDHATHHDAAHYADALSVPAATLSRALTTVTGRATKELITDRVMLEARRLLRFTPLSVGEVAHRVGFADPLYFSRAFKRATGEAPQAFRERARGR